MEIVVIDAKSLFLEKVISLGDANKSTLGLMPREAFKALAAQRLILCALDEKDNLCGYLLYGINKKDSFYYISHLCVEKSLRRNGIAEALFEELKKLTQKHFKGIRVHCRTDYEANKVWARLGFYARHEIPGKSKDGSRLTVWWYDYGYPTLFSDADEQRTQSKIKVAIDANIFFQLRETPSDKNEEAQALLTDWLQENIELCLTVEIYNEIERNKNENERKRNRIFADSFTRLQPSPDDKFSDICKNLQSFFPKKMNENDQSDLRHLARIIAAYVHFFITQDERLLKKSVEFYEKFKIRILRPSDLIIEQDSLIRDADYQPAHLSGSHVNIKRITLKEISFLDVFRCCHQREKKSVFNKKISLYLSDPRSFQADIIQDRDRSLALRIYNRSEAKEMEIPVLRIPEGSLSAVLARHIVFQAVMTSSEEGRILTKVIDNYLSDEIIDALIESGFVYINDIWVKANLPIVGTSKELISKLKSYKSLLPQYFDNISELIERSVSDNNIEMLLKTERSLFPAKITDINIPVFMIPIKARWAMELFDTEIARQSLFGAEPELMLNTENVYYRASHPKILSAPARILWYISKSRNYQGDQSVRACSYVNEVIIDTPKKLFSMFQRLGVYKWKDVLETADKDINKKIMAFQFSHTELFKNPISLGFLKKIWFDEDKKKFSPPQSPMSIPIQHFFHIYRIGMGYDSRGVLC